MEAVRFIVWTLTDGNARVGVARGYDEVSFYEITIPLTSSAKGDYRQLRIDGNNGQVIYDKVLPYRE